jgi:hypothetical protein
MKSLDLGAKGDQEGNAAVRDRPMKKEYDFSKACAASSIDRMQNCACRSTSNRTPAAFLRTIAEKKGTDVQQIVNDLIRRDINLIKSVG